MLRRRSRRETNIKQMHIFGSLRHTCEQVHTSRKSPVLLEGPVTPSGASFIKSYFP